MTQIYNETLNNVEVEYDVPQEFEIVSTYFEAISYSPPLHLLN